MSEPVQVLIKKLPGNEDIPLPTQMSELASGFDLFAAVKETVTLKPGERKLIPAGFSLAMPARLEAQIRPRSGLALKKGITCLNSPGTVDADYRGEVGVILINHGEESFDINRGDRIAQMVFQYVPAVRLEEADDLPDSLRGSGGFGHTGV
ncbi:MAG: dUTP diphosphatase [Bacillaceae bacterium]|nr:dUTP diphosphatase [Bacillaceae bacterium]